MPDPEKYHPHFNYSGWEAAGPKRPKPGAELDVDFANIARSIDETIDALKDIRRSDGKLKNGIVDKDALDESSRELWESAEIAAGKADQSAQAAAGSASGAAASAELARGFASDIVSQGNVPIYSTAQSVEGLKIPEGITSFRTNGGTTPGDGKGALYIESDSTSGTLQSGDGRWWAAAVMRDFSTFSTVADVQNSHIPAVLESIRTFGRNAPGDGPSLDLVRGSEAPGAVQSADGQWWEDVGYNTITVRIPTDFDTLQEAIDHYSRLPMRQGATINLLIESGHEPESGISVADGDYSHFIVVAEDAETVVSTAFPSDGLFISGNNAALPTLGCLINGRSRVYIGYHALDGSRGRVLAGAGVTHTRRGGLEVRSSTVGARNSIWRFAAQEESGSGILCWAGVVDAQSADCSDSGPVGQTAIGYGAQAAAGGFLNFRTGKADRSARYGVRATNAGRVNADGASAVDCGINAIRMFDGGSADARTFIGTGAGDYGASISNSSHADLRDADLSGAGVGGASVANASSASLASANCQAGSEPSANDIRVRTGSIVDAAFAIGGFSQPANRVTRSGIIFDPDSQDGVIRILERNSNQSTQSETFINALDLRVDLKAGEAVALEVDASIFADSETTAELAFAGPGATRFIASATVIDQSGQVETTNVSTFDKRIASVTGGIASVRANIRLTADQDGLFALRLRRSDGTGSAVLRGGSMMKVYPVL